MPSFLRAGLWIILLLAGLAARPAGATVFYDVYAGTGTSGTLLLGFQVPNIIPNGPASEQIADVIGTQASFFPAGTAATFSISGIFIPNGDDAIRANIPDDMLADLGQYSVGLVENLVLFTRDATLVVSNTAPVPEPGSLALFGTALVGFGAIRRRKREVA